MIAWLVQACPAPPLRSLYPDIRCRSRLPGGAGTHHRLAPAYFRSGASLRFQTVTISDMITAEVINA